MYAKDLIKMNNFKLVRLESNLYHSVINRTRVYPRPTANDVYVRNFELEEEEAYARSICCMPYDCMCYEAEYDRGFAQIWSKTEHQSLESSACTGTECSQLGNRNNQKGVNNGCLSIM